MNLEEARRLLGVATDASREDIDSQFKSRANSAHPDKGGADDDMAQLLEARDIALCGLTITSALVRVDVLQGALQAISTEGNRRREIESTATALQSNLKAKSTNPLRNYKRLSTFLAALATAAIFFGKDLPLDIIPQTALIPMPTGQGLTQDEFEAITTKVNEQNVTITEDNKDLKKLLLEVTFAVAIFAGVGAWFLTSRIDHVEQDLLELNESLSIKTNLYSILSGILKSKLQDKWTLKNLEEDIQGRFTFGSPMRTLVLKFLRGHMGSYVLPTMDEKWRRTVAMIGAEKFALLLVLKAQQVGLVEVNETMTDGNFSEYYSLVVGSDA